MGGDLRILFALAAVRGLNLMRNYGQHNALLCGIRAAKYEVVVTLDDDLQHPPEEIPRLLARLKEGFDVVYGAPKANRTGLCALLHLVLRDWRWARRSARCGEKRERISPVSHSIARGICRLSVSFCFHRRPAYMGNNALWRNNSSFSAAPFGLFKLYFRKLVRHALDMMTGFSSAPLQLASLIGFTCTLFGHWRFLLCFCSLLPGGKRPGISVSGLDNCNLFRRPAFRLGSHRRIPGADAFPLDETAGVRGADEDLALF